MGYLRGGSVTLAFRILAIYRSEYTSYAINSCWGCLAIQAFGRENTHAWLVGSVTLFTAAGRENIQNGQVTGLILLLFGIVLNLPESRIKNIIGTLMVLYCIELKPQVSIPILVFFYPDFKKILKYVPVAVVFLHTLIDAYVGEILEIDFLKRLINLSSQDPSNPWPDINNLLPLIDNLVNQTTVTKVFGVAIYSIVVVSMLKREYKVPLLVFSALFSPYMHTYDLIGIFAIVLSMFALNSRKSIYSVYFLALCLVPNMLNSIYLFLLAIVISLITVQLMIKTLDSSFSRFKATLVLCSIALSLSLNNINDGLLSRSGFVVMVCLGLLGLQERRSIFEKM